VAIPDPDNVTVAVVVVKEAYLVVENSYLVESYRVVEEEYLLRCLDVCVEALTSTEPLSVPTAGGENVMFSCALWPGASVYG